MNNRFSPSHKAMLTGRVQPLILRIAAPSVAAMLAVGTCTLLDALILSGRAGDAAAVGLCFPLLSAQQAVGFTLGMGAGSHMSRSLGAGEEDSARRVGAAALLLALVAGLLFMAVGLFFLRPLLTLLGASPDMLPHAQAYGRMLLLASPFTCLSLVLSSLLRAQGKTPANMLAYAGACVPGALCTWLLVLRLGLGPLGAGAALLVREALSFALLALAFWRVRGFVRPAPGDVTLRPWVFSAIMRSGLPTLLRQGAAVLSGLMLSRTAAGFGPATLSGLGIASRALALISSAAIGFGQGFSPVCAANHGAGNNDRVQEAYRFSLRVLVAALTLAGCASFALSGPLLRLFGADQETAAVAQAAMRAQSLTFPAQGAVILINMLTQALGRTTIASLAALSRQGLFLIPLLYILPARFGLPGLIVCQSAADLLALALCLALVRIVDRKAAGDYNRVQHK